MLPMVRQLMPLNKLRALVSLNMEAKIENLFELIAEKQMVIDKYHKIFPMRIPSPKRFPQL